MLKRNNKGFSLVELIVVIAIMAILVGMLAPSLIKQLEKAKVSKDLEVLATLCASIEYGLCDPEVMKDPASQAFEQAISSTVGMKLSDFEQAPYKDSAIYEYVKEASTFPDFTVATQMKHIQSYTKSSSEIYLARRGNFINPIAMWVTYSDKEGKRNPPASAAVDYHDITKEVALN